MNLLRAAEKGNALLVKLSLVFGKDVNAKDKEGRTALMIASGKGHFPVVKLLTLKKADLNAQYAEGRTALMEAAKKGHTKIARWLIENGADVNSKTKYGSEALMDASYFGHTETARLLIEKGAQVNARGDFKRTPLLTACIYGYIDIVRLLLEKRSDPRIKDEEGNSPLVEAANGLCAKKDSINFRSTALSDYLGIIELLLAGGVDINEKGKSWTALESAAFWGHSVIVKFLLSKGAASGDALMWAEREGHKDVAKLFKSRDTKAKDTKPAAEAEAPVFIPQINEEVEKIDLVDGGQLGDPGAGGDAFSLAIKDLNGKMRDQAMSHFKEALEKGLDPLRQGYAHAEMGNLMLYKKDLRSAIEHYMKVLAFKKSLYESVHHASFYLSAVLSELGRSREAGILTSLSHKTRARLGYSPDPAALQGVRKLVQESRKR